MKNEFINELKKRADSDIYIMGANKIRCFNCLDIGKVWCNRRLPFASLDGKGSYDYINCYKCQGNNDWSQCSHINNEIFNGIRICKEEYDLMNRINGFLKKDFKKEMDEIVLLKKEESKKKYENLKNKYENLKNEKLIFKKKYENVKNKKLMLKEELTNLEDKAEWNQLEEDTIDYTETETKISIAIDKIADVVEIIVKAYVGNIPNAIAECKNFAIALCMSNSNESITKNKIIRENDGENDIYLFLKLTKLNTQKTLWGGIRTEHTIKLTGHIFVLSPANKKANDICQKLLRDKARNLTEVISSIKMFE